MKIREQMEALLNGNKSLSESLKLWRYNPITGYWVYERGTTPSKIGAPRGKLPIILMVTDVPGQVSPDDHGLRESSVLN